MHGTETTPWPLLLPLRAAGVTGDTSVAGHVPLTRSLACGTDACPRASRTSPAAATSSQAAMATQITPRLRGCMKLRPAALPNDRVATPYMPIGKTTVHSADS